MTQVLMRNVMGDTVTAEDVHNLEPLQITEGQKYRLTWPCLTREASASNKGRMVPRADGNWTALTTITNGLVTP